MAKPGGAHHGPNVVRKLMGGLEHTRGHVFLIDIFCTSVVLLRDLLALGINMSGVVRANRIGLHKALAP